MDIKSIVDEFAVCPQVECADMVQIADAGFRTLICHRPDGEEDAQPDAELIAEAAAAAGLHFYAIPFAGGPSADAVQRYREIYRDAPRPILGYCRSGQRAETIWNEADVASSD